MWNEYIWENYKNAQGKSIIEMFNENLSKFITEDYPEQIQKLQEAYVADWHVRKDTYQQLTGLLEFTDQQVEVATTNDIWPDRAFEAIDEYFMEWCEFFWSDCINENNAPSEIDFKIIFENFCGHGLVCSTTLLPIYYPVELFVPYYFYTTYNVLESIANAFDIELPPLPAKSDYKGRVWHYANICKALYSFRIDKGLTFYELCAFLYDFAPKYVGGFDSYIIKNLPTPKSAYFVGGNGKGIDAIAEENPNDIIRWQCSPGARAGDLIVMYLRTPISAISSIWRAQSVGFIDPFFWYYRMTYIGSPIKINRIPISQIKADPILAKMPIVKKNMQGINGIELMPSEYNHIVELSGKDICRLEYVMEVGDEEYPNEKAVEEKLIKPLLKKLGYGENDYIQQMYIEIGNHNHALIPDFVLNPKRGGGHQSGFAVIEAKRSIKNDKQLEDAKGQVRGYAKLLGAKYSAVASMEKIYIMRMQDDYTEEIFSEAWDNLSDSDTLYRLRGLLGKS